MIGRAFLVGAGPGDPDLITVKGLRLIEEADVILYDRLANPALLKRARPDATLVDVGKRPRTGEETKQAWINALLVEYALAGNQVVRLKGGDPYVFGRGGEEVDALREAGVPYEVVPGISSSISVPSAAGIPVTHRGVADAFAVFTGHNLDAIAWTAAVAIPTAVFLMGAERIAPIAERLIAHGRSADTPAAVVASGTLPEQRVVTGSLRDIAARAEGVVAPAILVVGDVAARAEADVSRWATCATSDRP